MENGPSEFTFQLVTEAAINSASTFSSEVTETTKSLTDAPVYLDNEELLSTEKIHVASIEAQSTIAGSEKPETVTQSTSMAQTQPNLVTISSTDMMADDFLSKAPDATTVYEVTKEATTEKIKSNLNCKNITTTVCEPKEKRVCEVKSIYTCKITEVEMQILKNIFIIYF